MPISLPAVERKGEIPRILHQIFFNRSDAAEQLPAALQATIARITADNPRWQHRLYRFDDMRRFILENYEASMLAAFDRINPEYGAAQADFFRYLLMYKEGGVYLDVKSSIHLPLDTLIDGNPGYVIAQWDNGVGQNHEDWGVHDDLRHVPGGEFQQWHIVCAPGHPFLRAVIDSVVERIRDYSLWHGGPGRGGVLRLTGPITYTLAIAPLLDAHPHRRVATHLDLGLDYSVLQPDRHLALFGKHYSLRADYVVVPAGMRRIQTALYLAARSIKRRLSR